MADTRQLEVAEGEQVIHEGRVLPAGEKFEVAAEHVAALVESGAAKLVKAVRGS